MVAIDNDPGHAFEVRTRRPFPATRILGGIIDGLRRYRAARQTQRVLRQLSDQTLIDIGLDPASVRDEPLRITPATRTNTLVTLMR